MQHDKVGSVMTMDVVRAMYDTSFEEVARLQADHRIGGLPVVDDDDRVIGVVSASDLAARRTAAPDPHRTRRRFAFPAMSPAARTMALRGVKRLPVLDEEDRPAGLVTRRDLLRVFLRPDSDIRDEVVDAVLVRVLWLTSHSVDVSVTEGVVTLTGRLERRSETEVAVAMARRTDHVVAVVDELTWRLDDTRLRSDEQLLHGVADDRLRKL